MENKQSFYGGGSKSFYGVINSYGDINNLYEEKTITGPVNIASFNDGLKNKKIKQLIVAVEPQQDLHGYDNPWPAGGGKNLWKEYTSETKDGVTITNSNGKLTINGGNADNDVFFDIDVNYSVTSGQSIIMAAFNPVASTNRLTLFAITSIGIGNPQVNLNSANAISTQSAGNDAILNKLRLRVPSGQTYTNFVLYPYLQIGGTAPTSWSPYSNICPISGWTGAKVERCGKNLIDTSDITDYTKWSATVAPGGDMGSKIDNRIYSFPKIKAGLQYTISFGVTSSSFPSYLYFGYYKDGITTRIAYVTTEGVANQVITFTAIEGVTYCLRMGSTLTQGAFEGQIAKLAYIQLELGSTATSYVPYSGNTYSISWQTEAGTVYGGSLDVTTGVLTVDRIYALLNDASAWYEVSGNPKFRCSTAFADRKKYNNSYDGLSACSYIQINALEYTNTGRWVSSSSDNFGIESSDLTLAQIQQDATEGKIAIVYELATPLTYQLTPTEVSTLLGDNNVWADTGPVEKLVYIAKKE